MTVDIAIPRVRPLVLVIDDSATYRAAIRHTLLQAGYDVAAAVTGDEGLRAAAQLRPDVLVVDRVLPDVDGTALIRNIRLDATLRRIPCLLITADDDPEVEFTALETGADAFVRKDEDLTVLLARVAALRRDTPTPPSVSAVQVRRRILVAPSDPALHVADAHLLPVAEYDVLDVRDPESAVAALHAGEVACVVLAIADAASARRALAALVVATREQHVPILVMQHADSPMDASEMLTAGADDYVSSADGPALYVARLHALIRRKEMENEDRRVSQTLLGHEADAAAARVRAEVAERESEFKERFVATMSHELRTPLNAILGFTQLLERGVGGELTQSQRKHVGGVLRSAEHLLALVNDVLDLSKVRAGKLVIRKDAVRLNEVAENVKLTVGGLATQRGLTFVVSMPATLPPVVGDPVRIQQIFYNLLSNSIKFTLAGGTVSLSGIHEGAFVRLSVKDTGIGIRREDFGRLFRDFERLEHSQSQKADGTGLGLALTRHLVDLHGGRIEVQSEVNIGSCFTVWLPVAPLS